MNTEQSTERLPDEQVVVKLSYCNKCDGVITCAVLHKMDAASKREFMKEVMKYDLSVKYVPLLEFRAGPIKWCDCNEPKTLFNQSA